MNALSFPFLDSIVDLDRAWTLAVNGLHCPASDAFWLFMSGKNVWFILYALVATLMIWKLGWKKGLVYVVATILSIVCIDQICNLVKNSVCRLRPSSDPDMIASGLYLLQKPGRHIYGFFSAHAANSFGFATATFLALRQISRGDAMSCRPMTSASPAPESASTAQSSVSTAPVWVDWYGVGIYVWAFLVAASRIFCAKHFIGDILVGAIAGSLIAWGIFSLARHCILRFVRYSSYS